MKLTRIARISGILILIGIVTGIFSIIPAVENIRFLKDVSKDVDAVYIGGIFQFLLLPIYLCFTLLIYPVLQQSNKPLALGFLGFRFMAGTFQLIGVLLLPLFIELSHYYTSSNTINLNQIEITGNLLLTVRDLINHFGVIVATSLGNLLFYFLFLNNQLIPRWLSIWGMVGNLLIVLAGFFLLFNKIEVVSIEYAYLSGPIVIQEIILALWLIFKGFNLEKEERLNPSILN